MSSNEVAGKDAGTATSGVVEGLTRSILADFKPGDRLDSEADLARRFGVSRVTLREALRTLAGKGLVELSRGRRAVVRQPDSSAFGDYLASVIQFDPKGMFDLVEVRLSLEVQSVTLAAQRISRPGLGRRRRRASVPSLRCRLSRSDRDGERQSGADILV